MSGASRPRLRGHHLICLRFFTGEGYSAEFVRNLVDVLARAADGLVVVDGADDVCAACPSLGSGGACEHVPGADAGIRALDALALELLGMSVGRRTHPGDIAERMPGVLQRWFAEACADCEWAHVCERARAASASSSARFRSRPQP